ncbi:enoyl-CoA hydratase-related protein [Photobacterium halotolerans]|uniref:Gamma-carboxygeranoyl-CoA hydratase n=1 Tax=Photobacterium halotolerans TaxID=265726 RepID=A0A7X5BKT2_9GAMM|nr:enoyl-CoA hydratase-related protein [Photobacterium halotolerans]NAW64344.1 gamma-carboxygeranoyl-CoA hydratase [Photobacterium halotolerans]NAX45467.1 gamma-carboxygeranoyl-CoA hydratase [Photobacterium halotolerans]
MTIEYQLDQRGCAHIQLSREQVHNALNEQVIAGLIALIDRAHQEQAKAILLSSRGKHFSAGADLAWMKSMANNSREENLADSAQLAALMSKLNTASMPVITVVQGAAYGGALGLIACSDIVIAARNAAFCLSEVKLGLIPAVISPYVIRAMGESQARRYFLTAEVFNAEDALRLGLIHQISDEPGQVAEQMLEQILMNSPQALIAAKQLISDVSGRSIDAELIADTAQRIADIRVSEEGQEGLAAFFDKRPPSWVS